MRRYVGSDRLLEAADVFRLFDAVRCFFKKKKVYICIYIYIYIEKKGGGCLPPV